MISIRHQLKKYRISWRKTRRQIIFARAWSLTSSTLRSTSAKFPWSSIRLCTEIMNGEVTRISQSIHVGVLSSTVPPVSRHFSGLYLEWEENPVTDRLRPFSHSYSSTSTKNVSLRGFLKHAAIGNKLVTWNKKLTDALFCLEVPRSQTRKEIKLCLPPRANQSSDRMFVASKKTKVAVNQKILWEKK